MRIVFKGEYFCEECGEFIGSIDDCYWLTEANLILCESCYNKFRFFENNRKTLK